MEERFVIVTEYWTSLFVHKVVLENAEKVKIYAVNDNFSKTFLPRFAKIFEG